MKRRTSISSLAMAAVVAVMTLTLTGTASADLTTRCVGEGGAITVQTDLVVPNGQTCVLNGTVIEGDVRVGAHADLVADNVTIAGDVRVRVDSYLETWDSEIGGRVILRGSFGTFLTTTSVEGNVSARPTANVALAGFVAGEDVTLGNRIVVDSGELLLDGADVAGDVIARDSLYADIYSSFIDGRLRSIRTQDGSVVCGSAVQGDARIMNNAFTVQVGGDSPLVECDNSNYFGSGLRVQGTDGGVFLDNNLVNGDLTLRNNDPVAQVGDANMVRGDIRGDYESGSTSALQAQAKSQLKTMSSADARIAKKVVSRGDAIDAKVEVRREAALAEAAAAGKAF